MQRVRTVLEKRIYTTSLNAPILAFEDNFNDISSIFHIVIANHITSISSLVKPKNLLTWLGYKFQHSFTEMTFRMKVTTEISNSISSRDREYHDISCNQRIGLSPRSVSHIQLLIPKVVIVAADKARWR